MKRDRYREELDRVTMDETFRRELVDAMAAARPERRGLLWPLRMGAAALAACFLVTVGAAAASPTLRQALLEALGSFAPFAREQEGVATGQGIQVKVVSALADSYNMQVYAAVTDLTGDRLSTASFEGIIDMEVGGESSGSFYTEVLHYDPESRTALLRFSDWTGGVIGDDLGATLRLSSIQPDYHYFHTEDIPLDLLTAETRPTLTLATGQVVIAPGLNDYPLAGKEGDGLTVSSIGFTDDGRLHILFRFPEGTRNGKQYALCSPLWSEDRAEREGWSYGYGVPVSTKSGVRFEWNGGVYYDNVVPIGPADLPDVAALSSATVLYSTQEAIKGNWEVPITFTRVEEKVSPLAGQIDHSRLTQLRLSPMNVIVASTSDDGTQIGGYPMMVFLADGSSLHPRWGQIGGGTDWSVHLARWVFDEPVDVDAITGVAIGAWMIPVERGVAGAGHWLAEPPQ